MDNSSPKIEEGELSLQNSNNEKTNDIKFEEVINIDEIQEKLKKDLIDDDLSDNEEETNSEFNFDNVFESENSVETLDQPEPFFNNDSNMRKYVIYVDADNINYIENLSIDDRKAVINNILRDQNKINEDEKKLKARKQFLTHVILACMTFVICFPILFFIVNKSANVTVNNYNEAKSNFSKLYKNQGKIKMK